MEKEERGIHRGEILEHGVVEVGIVDLLWWKGWTCEGGKAGGEGGVELSLPLAEEVVRGDDARRSDCSLVEES